jgi:hypothetical protein
MVSVLWSSISDLATALYDSAGNLSWVLFLGIMLKVPPGDAGHPVCLDSSTKFRPQLLESLISSLNTAHAVSLTLSAP